MESQPQNPEFRTFTRAVYSNLLKTFYPSSSNLIRTFGNLLEEDIF